VAREQGPEAAQQLVMELVAACRGPAAHATRADTVKFFGTQTWAAGGQNAITRTCAWQLVHAVVALGVCVCVPSDLSATPPHPVTLVLCACVACCHGMG
jgi:hypothetical protein